MGPTLPGRCLIDIDRPADGNQDFFIFAVAVMIFFNQHQDVVYIDFYLLNQLDFKFNIVPDILFFGIAPSAVTEFMCLI